jgi:hypothetical protein
MPSSGVASAWEGVFVLLGWARQDHREVAAVLALVRRECMVRRSIPCVNEIPQFPRQRVHHNNDACPSGRDIPTYERRPGDGGYRLCKECENLR